MNIEKDLVTLESDIIMANTTAVIKFAFFFHPRFSFINIHEGEAISLTPFYLFLPLHRNQDISRAITAESSLLHSNRELLYAERKSLTTKSLNSSDCKSNMNLLNDFAKEFLSLIQKEYKQVDIIIDNNNFPIAL